MCLGDFEANWFKFKVLHPFYGDVRKGSCIGLWRVGGNEDAIHTVAKMEEIGTRNRRMSLEKQRLWKGGLERRGTEVSIAEGRWIECRGR